MKNLFALSLCLSTALSMLAQSEYCGVGTVWDAESQTCIVAENVELLDSNLDGVVGVEDLLNLLSHFGDEDMDFDGIYDSVDDCVGAYDECGVCNGPGPQILGIDTIIVYYDSLYAEAIDEWWVFEVDADTLLGYFCEYSGCTNPTADNFDPYAFEDDGSCMGGDPCANATTVTFDNYDYELVAIGNQCWFAENLRTTTYANGDSIPGDLDGEAWGSTNEGAMAIFGEGNSIVWSGDENEVANLELYGRLYNGFAVFDERGLCPNNWHVPSDEEWMTLELTLGMSETELALEGSRGTDQGSQMKATFGWGGGEGNNSSGFTGLPGGGRGYGDGGWFMNGGFSAFFWASTPFDELTLDPSAYAPLPLAWMRELQKNNSQVSRTFGSQYSGHSIRCLKN